jgi:hypothetical protein
LKLTLVQADSPVGNVTPEEWTGWRPPAVRIVGDHLETAGMAWRAYRQTTPQGWFDLLGEDLTVLPRLRQFWTCLKNFRRSRRGLVRPKCGCWS